MTALPQLIAKAIAFDHGDARRIQLELAEIGHGRQGQADVQNLHAAFEQAEDQRPGEGNTCHNDSL